MHRKDYEDEILHEEAVPGKGETKNFSDSWLYSINIGNYEKTLVQYIKGYTLDKEDPSFKDVVYDMQRRIGSESAIELLKSPVIVLKERNEGPLPKCFQTITIANKNTHKLSTFVYNTMITHTESGSYKLRANDADKFIYALNSAGFSTIYYSAPKIVLLNSAFTNNGAELFATMFTFIIDYLYKIGNVPGSRANCMYASILYFYNGICRMTLTDSVKAFARKISGLSANEADLVDYQVDLADDNPYKNIKTFVQFLGELLHLKSCALEPVISKWAYVYGQGTQFALELLPSFTEMLLFAYGGCRMNNEQSITKTCPPKAFLQFNRAALRIIDSHCRS